MLHLSEKGAKKIMTECSLPVTGSRVVNKIITDIAVFEVSQKDGLTLVEKHASVSVQDIKDRTDAPFFVSATLKDMVDTD
jgi:acyl CoA:acetate/3-ketoacid CoA transferase beta subunit